MPCPAINHGYLYSFYIILSVATRLLLDIISDRAINLLLFTSDLIPQMSPANTYASATKYTIG